jgi:hypothetical protein
MTTITEQIKDLIKIGTDYFNGAPVFVTDDEEDAYEDLAKDKTAKIRTLLVKDYYNIVDGSWGVPAVLKTVKVASGLEFIIGNLRNTHESYHFAIVPKASYLTYKRYIRSLNEQPKMILSDYHKKEVVNPIISLMSNGSKYAKYGCTSKLGFLLTGKPGNGKSMIVSYVQNMRHFRSSSNIFTGNFLNQSGLSYEMNKKLLIFDDIDVNLFNRESGPEVGKFLSLLDGVNKHKQQVRIFTTNMEVDTIDKAFLRPGRIDKIVKFDLPNEALRKEFIETWHSDFLQFLNIDQIVADTKGWSFAQIDAIRTNLVTNHLFDNVWDYELAKAKVIVHEDETHSIGFST